jgi:hypothetical protein
VRMRTSTAYDTGVQAAARRRPQHRQYPGQPARPGHGVPVLQPVPEHDRPGQRRLRVADPQDAGVRTQRPSGEASGTGGPADPGGPVPASALRRAAADRSLGRWRCGRAYCCSTSHCRHWTLKCGSTSARIARTSSTPVRTAACRTRSGYGRPRRSVVGTRARSARSVQPSASRMAIWLERLKPVVSDSDPGLAHAHDGFGSSRRSPRRTASGRAQTSVATFTSSAVRRTVSDPLGRKPTAGTAEPIPRHSSRARMARSSSWPVRRPETQSRPKLRTLAPRGPASRSTWTT